MGQIFEGFKSFLKRMIGVETCSSCQGVLGCCSQPEDQKVKIIIGDPQQEMEKNSEDSKDRVWIKL